MMPKKSDAMHFLCGTKSQAKSGDEPTLPAGRPKFPKGLSVEAKRVFRRLVALLESRRTLTEGDCELLRIYSVLFDRHQRALEKIQEQGEVCVYTRLDSNGQPHDAEKPNLWLKIAETSEKNMIACLDRLGLTPINRSKVKPTGPAKNETGEYPEGSIGWLEQHSEEDGMSELLNRPATWVQPAADDLEVSNDQTDFTV